MPEIEFLRRFFEEQKVPIWGICCLEKLEADGLPEELRRRFKTAVVFAFPLSSALIDSLADGPDPTYLHHYRQVNYFLDRAGLLLTDLLQQNGFSGLPVPASQVVDWEKQKGLLSHRRLAVAAGLGWLGRNNLLVTKDYGSRIRLATVLTDASLPESPCRTDGCGECLACLVRCPAVAIKEKPGDFNPQTCFRFIRDICRKKGISQNICGLCLCSPAWRDKKKDGKP